uniref:Thiamine-triphosphatase n=1 Tax=Oryzias latipes TaxID=8090 RepID=A0A3P9K6G4_ORYLA
MSVEVERKFLCSEDTLKILEKIGVCIGQREFQDQYFDSPGFELTLRDIWLRKRKGCWELKCPISTGEPSEEQSLAAKLCTQYKEITNLPEIQQRVKKFIKGTRGDRDTETASLQEDELWLSQLNLVCFAEFTTVRRSFTLEEGVQIDLDQADFGYHVGEIEVLIPEGGDVHSAQEKIRNAAQKLGELIAFKLIMTLTSSTVVICDMMFS